MAHEHIVHGRGNFHALRKPMQNPLIRERRHFLAGVVRSQHLLLLPLGFAVLLNKHDSEVRLVLPADPLETDSEHELRASRAVPES